MNVEIGAEAVLFPEKEYINGIAVAVHDISRFWEISSDLWKIWLKLRKCATTQDAYPRVFLSIYIGVLGQQV
jgi:hypothetical protein